MWASQEEQMIATQAQLITELRQQVALAQAELRAEKAKYAESKQAGVFYLKMQQAIKENPILQTEWTRFCSFLKMADPDHGK